MVRLKEGNGIHQIKAADITDEMFKDAIDAVKRGEVGWAPASDVARYLGFPLKVVLAKARRLIKRGVIGGCACGCRGDFHYPKQW